MTGKTFFMGLLLASVFLSALCTEKKEPTDTGGVSSTAPEITTSAVSEASTSTTPEDIPLSDLQISACGAADSGHTCRTKLADLGIVSPDDCCKYLDKCCPVN